MDYFVYKPWRFFSDTNGDGAITITDVWNWLVWLFFLPGDCFLYFIMAVFPDLAQFFELSSNSYHGFISGIFSFIVWVVIIFNLWVIKISFVEWLDKLDEVNEK